METIVITPRSHDSVAVLAELLSRLKDVKKVEIVSLPKTKSKTKKSRLYKEVDKGLKEVKNILEGKQTCMTLQDLIDEL